MSEQEVKTSERVSADAMTALRESGLTNVEIAERLTCSRALVYRKIGAQPDGMRKNKHKPSQRGERIPGAATKEAMLERRALGLSNSKIADALGVSRQYVHRLIGPGEGSSHHGTQA